MIVHFYGLCWNDARMLPYFFQHYDALVDRYFIFDNGSTDESLRMLNAHSRVEVGTFEYPGNSFVAAARDFYNEVWKSSRGVADWVIIANLDEHLYHPAFREYLEQCGAQSYSVIVPTGYEMVALRFPRSPAPLWKQVKLGQRNTMMDKPQIIDPKRISEINFTWGRHTAEPKGDVHLLRSSELLLLHFKQLGIDTLPKRQKQLGTNMRSADVSNYHNRRIYHQLKLLRTRFFAEEVLFPASLSTRVIRFWRSQIERWLLPTIQRRVRPFIRNWLWKR